MTTRVVLLWICIFQVTLSLCSNIAVTHDLPPTSSSTPAQTFLWGLKFIMNIDGQVVANSSMQASLDSLIGAGITGFRHFYRKTPTSNIGGYSPGPATADQLSQPFALTHYAISKGLKVILGCGDVTNPADVVGNALDEYYAQVTLCAQLIKAENFQSGYIAVEWANELAGNTNDYWNAVNMKMNTILRSYLPFTPIILKGCNWGYYSNNIDGSLMIPLDDNFIFGHHSYTMVDLESAKAQAYQINQFWSHNGFAGVIFEEAGFNNGNNGTFDAQIWQANYQIWTTSYSPFNEPMGMWAITEGQSFRANEEGSLLPRSSVLNITSYFSGKGGYWHY